MFALALGLSITGLLAGATVFARARGRGRLEAAFDGFAIGLIPTVILARLLPELAVERGLAAIVLIAVGYVGSWWLESRTHSHARHARHAGAIGPVFVVLALAAHALVDGAALAVAFRASAPVPSSEATMLIGTLVAHKVPEGVFVASTLAPAAGAGALAWRVALVGGATVAGGLGGRELLEGTPDAAVHGLIAFGLGVMLRFVAHRHVDPRENSRSRAMRATSFVVGVACALALPSPRSHWSGKPPPFASANHPEFVSAALAAAPWIAGVFVLVIGLRTMVAHRVRPPRGDGSTVPIKPTS